MVITWPIMLKTHLSCFLKIKKIPLACESTESMMKQKNNRKSRGIPQDNSDSLKLIGDSEQKTLLDTAPCGQNVVELIHCNGQKTKVETKVNPIQPSKKRQICRELIINIEFTERQVNPIITHTQSLAHLKLMFHVQVHPMPPMNYKLQNTASTIKNMSMA